MSLSVKPYHSSVPGGDLLSLRLLVKLLRERVCDTLERSRAPSTDLWAASQVLTIGRAKVDGVVRHGQVFSVQDSEKAPILLARSGSSRRSIVGDGIVHAHSLVGDEWLLALVH